MSVPTRASRASLAFGALFLLLPVAPSCAVPPAGEAPEPPRLSTRDLFADAMWDDGRAEYSLYEGTIERYGSRRPLAARLIVVKEDMDIGQRVKSEAGPVAGRTKTVLKQNYSHDFTTGTYDYHQASSTFLDRATGRLEKLTTSSIEGCGLTFVSVRGDTKGVGRVSHSYWDGEADREEVKSCSDCPMVLLADALPLWLRRLDLARPQSFLVTLLPSQLSNRVAPLELVPSRIEVVGGTPDRHGRLVRVVATDSGRVEARPDRYWFDPAWPHALVRFEGGKHSIVLERMKTMRIAYWKETDPGDERLLRP
jgi:hypothetical protein